VGWQDAAEWLGLEERVCAAAPFSTKEILPNHGSLTVVIAGFGLAGFVLLLDRGHEPVQGERRRGHTIGALLLALSAIVGLVAGYMFSSITGDHCMSTAQQFDYPSALLVISALLLVSGISVAAASQPLLHQTAAALRFVLILTGVLVCVRLFVDYERAAAVSQRYGEFSEVVGELKAPSYGSRQALDAGSTATLDQQLYEFAKHRWGPSPDGRYPADEDEYPGLLADYFYDNAPSPMTRVSLSITGGIAALGAVWIRWRMRDVVGRRFPEESDPNYKHSPEAAKDKPMESWWKRWTSATTVGATVAVVGLFSWLAGTGDELARAPSAVWVILFAIVVAVTAFVVQPPLVGDQEPIWRHLPSRHSTTAPSNERSGTGGPVPAGESSASP
jgi:hypothetical protein